MNQAVVLVKPHANLPEFVEDVEDVLEANTLIEKRFKIKTTKEQADKHYRAISDRALNGIHGSSILSAVEYLEKFPGEEELARKWRQAEQVTVEKNYYIAKVGDHWVANGFYPLMQKDFDNRQATVFVVRFDYAYESFKKEIIGSTDSSKAPFGSIRQIFHKHHREKDSDLSFNGVHASCGAIEGVKDLALWAGVHFTDTALYEHEDIRYAMENKELPKEFDTYEISELRKACKDWW
jgi:nucleoside diphosphate kinase